MEQSTVKVAAFLTAARYENTLARNHIEMALHTCGINLIVSGGVYYGQCMQSMLEDAVSEGLQYAITVDGDSMFVASDVKRLLGLIVGNKEIDAVCGLQAKRGSKHPLASKTGEKTVTITGSPIPISTGHFGLTVIDMKKLANVPKPWFAHVPDANGSWGDDKIDDDIYFWRQWEKAGNTLYLDPQCRVGHLEEVVTVFDETMTVQQMYPEDWRDANKVNTRDRVSIST